MAEGPGFWGKHVPCPGGRRVPPRGRLTTPERSWGRRGQGQEAGMPGPTGSHWVTLGHAGSHWVAPGHTRSHRVTSGHTGSRGVTPGHTVSPGEAEAVRVCRHRGHSASARGSPVTGSAVGVEPPGASGASSTREPLGLRPQGSGRFCPHLRPGKEQGPSKCGQQGALSPLRRGPAPLRRAGLQLIRYSPPHREGPAAALSLPNQKSVSPETASQTHVGRSTKCPDTSWPSQVDAKSTAVLVYPRRVCRL